MNRYNRLLAALLLSGIAAPLLAQDADGCKDHPLFNRLKGYDLASCNQKEFDEARLPVGPAAQQPDGWPAKSQRIEGRVTELDYFPAEGSTPGSSLQVIRNFQNAVKAAGGTVEGEYQHVDIDISGLGGGERATTLKLVKGREAWALLRADGDGPYHLLIVEREALKQEIVAKDLLDKLNKDGFVALYINFDTAKATIKPDSAKVLDEVAAMLKSAPALKIEVGGHTDNVGGAEANQKLSEARAQSVVAALGQRGIAASRLTAKGYGQSAPVADNRSEEGRAKNRRVELKKL